MVSNIFHAQFFIIETYAASGKHAFNTRLSCQIDASTYSCHLFVALFGEQCANFTIFILFSSLFVLFHLFFWYCFFLSFQKLPSNGCGMASVERR